MEFKVQLIKNFVYSYLGVMLLFITSLMRAKIFQPEGMGKFSYIISLASVLNSVVSIGIPRIILKYYSDKNNFLKEIIKIQTNIYILSIVAVICINVFYQINDIALILLLTLNLLFFSIFDMVYIVFDKSEESNFYQKVFFNLLDILLLCIFLTMKLYNIVLYMYVYVTVKLIILLILYSKVEKLINFDSKRIKEKKEYFTFGIFAMLNLASSILVISIDKIMIKQMLGYNYVGVYSIATMLSSILLIVNNVFLRTLSPKISNYLKDNRVEKLKEIALKNSTNQIYLGYIIMGCMFISSNYILNFLGNNYTEGKNVIILIMIGNLALLYSGVCGCIISLSEYFRFEFYFNVLLLLLMIIGNYFFIRSFGITGASFATMLSLIAINLLRYLFILYKYKFSSLKINSFKFIISFLFSLIITNKIIGSNLAESILIIVFKNILFVLLYEIILFFLKEEVVLYHLKKKWGKKNCGTT